MPLPKEPEAHAYTDGASNGSRDTDGASNGSRGLGSRWVSEDTVLGAYRIIASSHYHRVPGDKTIRVLNFVLEQTDEEGHRPSFATLYDRWNKANPQEAYSDRSAFSKAYKRAVKALVPPYLPLT